MCPCPIGLIAQEIRSPYIEVKEAKCKRRRRRRRILQVRILARLNHGLNFPVAVQLARVAQFYSV